MFDYLQIQKKNTIKIILLYYMILLSLDVKLK